MSSCPCLLAVHHRTVRLEPPAGNRIQVIARRPQPPKLDHLGACWLRVTGLVDRAAQDDRLGARPIEQVTESGVRLRQDRLLERRGCPRLALVRADVDACDRPTRPGPAAGRAGAWGPGADLPGATPTTIGRFVMTAVWPSAQRTLDRSGRLDHATGPVLPVRLRYCPPK